MKQMSDGGKFLQAAKFEKKDSLFLFTDGVQGKFKAMAETEMITQEYQC